MSERLSLLNGALIVSAGVNSFDTPVHVNAALKPGVKVVVLLSGRMHIKIGSAPMNEICGPACFVIRNTNETPRVLIILSRGTSTETSAGSHSDGVATRLCLNPHARLSKFDL